MSLLDKLIKKYDIKPEKNDPVELYGVPFSEEVDAQLENSKKDEEVYNIMPEENIPVMLYGIKDIKGEIKPLESDNIEKYNIKPEDNNPTKLYGVVNFRDSVMKSVERMKNEEEKDENV